MFFFLLHLGGSVAAEAGAFPLLSAWQDAANYSFNEAHQKIIALRSNPSISSRELDYAEAILLLNVQPKTESNIQEASQLFQSVAANGADELSLYARYYIARILHVHQSVPDLIKAEASYLELIGQYPQHILAQESLLKLSILYLYELKKEEPMEKRIQKVNLLGQKITDPVISGMYHGMMADCLLRFSSSSKKEALDHLLLYENAGIQRPKKRAFTLIQIGLISRELGDYSISKKYFGKFLTEFKRDGRVFIVKNIVQEMEK